MPDSLVDNIPLLSMDPEKQGDKKNSDTYDVMDASKVPPQSDTHLFGCSKSDYSVCNILPLSVDPEKEGDTEHNDSNYVIDLSKPGARKDDYTHQFSKIDSLSTESTIHDWSKVSPRSQCLSPKMWLEGETIEQAIAAFIQ